MYTNIIVGLLLIAGSILQFFAARKAFSVYKTTEKKTSNPIRIYGLLFGFLFAGILLIMGISILFGILG